MQPNSSVKKAVATSANSTAAAPRALASMGYAFTLREQRLHLERTIVQPDGSRTPWVGLLASAIAKRALPANLAPSQADLKIDRITEGRATLRVPLHELPALFDALAPSEHVSVDGAPRSGLPKSPPPPSRASRPRPRPLSFLVAILS